MDECVKFPLDNTVNTTAVYLYSCLSGGCWSCLPWFFVRLLWRFFFQTGTCKHCFKNNSQVLAKCSKESKKELGWTEPVLHRQQTVQNTNLQPTMRVTHHKGSTSPLAKILWLYDICLCAMNINLYQLFWIRICFKFELKIAKTSYGVICSLITTRSVMSLRHCLWSEKCFHWDVLLVEHTKASYSAQWMRAFKLSSLGNNVCMDSDELFLVETVTLSWCSDLFFL